jgi:hypothetical protein
MTGLKDNLLVRAQIADFLEIFWLWETKIYR